MSFLQCYEIIKEGWPDVLRSHAFPALFTHPTNWDAVPHCSWQSNSSCEILYLFYPIICRLSTGCVLRQRCECCHQGAGGVTIMSIKLGPVMLCHLCQAAATEKCEKSRVGWCSMCRQTRKCLLNLRILAPPIGVEYELQRFDFLAWEEKRTVWSKKSEYYTTLPLPWENSGKNYVRCCIYIKYKS